MKYEYSKLDGRITEMFGTRKAFAEAVMISEHTISGKMTGKIGWTQEQINKVCEVLQIPHEDIPSYFFSHLVQGD